MKLIKKIKEEKITILVFGGFFVYMAIISICLHYGFEYSNYKAWQTGNCTLGMVHNIKEEVPLWANLGREPEDYVYDYDALKAKYKTDSFKEFLSVRKLPATNFYLK